MHFGYLADGRAVQQIKLSAGKFTATIINWGAVVQDLRLEGHDAPLVLGFTSLDDYVNHSPYFGSMIGRFANRIRHGKFTLDGQTYQLEQNYREKHHLHGGREGMARQIWKIDEVTADSVRLSYHSPAGEMGYPSALDVACLYRLCAPSTLRFEITATSDGPTLCNITNHSYFNLADGGLSDVLYHQVEIAASEYLERDDFLISTGAINAVEATRFDWRRPATIWPDRQQPYQGNDHCYVFSRHRPDRLNPKLHYAAKVTSPDRTLGMELWTSENAVQFYDGGNLNCNRPGLKGHTYPRYAALCLETQGWPDAPNHSHFPSTRLDKGQTYRHISEYRFQRTAD